MLLWTRVIRFSDHSISGRGIITMLAAPIQPPGENRQGEEGSWHHQNHQVGRQVRQGMQLFKQLMTIGH